MSKSRASSQIVKSIRNLMSVVRKPAPAILPGRSPADTIRVGLVGCGGRGTGIVADALSADPKAELVAVADLDPEQAQRSLNSLRKMPNIAGQSRSGYSRNSSRVSPDTARGVHRCGPACVL